MNLSKEGSAISDTQKTNTLTLEKKLKVVNKPYKDTYVLGLNLQGKYMAKYGFLWHDVVNVTVSENRILIEKVIEEPPSQIN